MLPQSPADYQPARLRRRGARGAALPRLGQEQAVPRKYSSCCTSALRCVSKTAERFYEAELRRLVGELTLSIDSSKVAEARQASDEAITVARARHGETKPHR
jgi:hypothetical protein